MVVEKAIIARYATYAESHECHCFRRRRLFTRRLVATPLATLLRRHSCLRYAYYAMLMGPLLRVTACYYHTPPYATYYATFAITLYTVLAAMIIARQDYAATLGH